VAKKPELSSDARPSDPEENFEWRNIIGKKVKPAQSPLMHQSLVTATHQQEYMSKISAEVPPHVMVEQQKRLFETMNQGTTPSNRSESCTMIKSASSNVRYQGGAQRSSEGEVITGSGISGGVLSPLGNGSKVRYGLLRIDKERVNES
jgi:hypothetical protein